MFVASFVLILVASCNSASNISNEDICGKEFTENIPDPMYSDLSTSESTVLNCDGTFQSSSTHAYSGSNPDGQSIGNHPINFTGTWQIVKNIPDNVKQAVIEYGHKDNDYSIIEYKSSNGVSGYCLYYYVGNSYTLSPLNTGQVSQYAWGHDEGAAGIFDGFSRK